VLLGDIDDERHYRDASAASGRMALMPTMKVYISGWIECSIDNPGALIDASSVEVSKRAAQNPAPPPPGAWVVDTQSAGQVSHDQPVSMDPLFVSRKTAAELLGISPF
jgi:hypothetical protein